MKILPDVAIFDSTFPDKSKFAKVPKEVIVACSDRAVKVYAALAIYRNYETNKCNPSIRKLAMDLRVHESTVKRGIDELVALGIITKKMQYTKHGGITSSLYTLCEPWVSSALSPSCKSAPVGLFKSELPGGAVLTYKQEETNDKNLNDIPNNQKELFDAVCLATSIEISSITKSQRKKIDTTVLGLLEVSATSEQVLAKAKKMKAIWPNIKVTHNMLLNRWAEVSLDDESIKPIYGIIEKDEPYVWDDEQCAVIPNIKNVKEAI